MSKEGNSFHKQSFIYITNRSFDASKQQFDSGFFANWSAGISARESFSF